MMRMIHPQDVVFGVLYNMGPDSLSILLSTVTNVLFIVSNFYFFSYFVETMIHLFFLYVTL